MATPSQQRSRYPRPLKATQNFTASGEASTPQASVHGMGSTGSSSCHSVATPSGGAGLPSTVGEGVSYSTAIVGGSSVPLSPKNRSTGSKKDNTDKHTEDTAEVEVDGENPRRSSSMDCLSDPDSYTWPRLSSTNQESKESELATREGFSHKRSNSCSGADNLPRTPPLKGNGANAVHTRTSIEGLNQEVSSALEGKQIMPSQHPDGHRAPIRDLVGRPPVSTPTPPHTLGLSSHTSHPSSPSPSPYSPHPPMSPSPASHSTSITETSDTPTGHASTQTRESPGTPDNAHHHPSSPKPSFAHEPPDGAERCIIKQELNYTADHIPKGPDKSKASIVFRGSGTSAFAPLLSSHGSLKQLGGVQC